MEAILGEEATVRVAAATGALIGATADHMKAAVAVVVVIATTMITATITAVVIDTLVVTEWKNHILRKIIDL